MKCHVDLLTIKKAKRFDLSNPITKALTNIKKAIEASEHELVDDAKDADVVFVFGSITVRKHGTERAQRILQHRMNHKKIISLDSSFFSTYIRNSNDSSQTYFFRVGLGDCTGEGDFLNEDSPSDRYEWFKKSFSFEEKEPRVQPEAPILFVLQSEKGWMYNNQEPFYMWARATLERLRKLTTRRIILRTHPNTDRYPVEWITRGFDNVSITYADRGRRTLFDDLDKVGCVITHSSSSTVESYVEGIPTIALDERCVNYKDLDNSLSKLNDPSSYDWSNRQQKLNDWAYTSWHVSEMEKPEWVNYYLSKI